jgi:hypothetical protein
MDLLNLSIKNKLSRLVLSGIPLDGLEPCPLDQVNGLLFGHLHLAIVCIAVSELAAVGNGAVEVEQRY